MKNPNYIRVVLVEPTHPGNIGATARAMANMGVHNLVLVNPREFPSEIANARASGADQLLAGARVVQTLDEAISDCTHVLGTTARTRSIDWPSLSPWEAMEKLCVQVPHSPAALLFGRESSGLTNSELDRCNFLIRVPTDDAYSSLNLGTAVAILLYEYRKQLNKLEQGSLQAGLSGEERATASDLSGLYEHLEKTLIDIEFTDGRSGKLMRKIIRMFNRIQPYRNEVNILRGILTAVDSRLSDAGRTKD